MAGTRVAMVIIAFRVEKFRAAAYIGKTVGRLFCLPQ
jgi:hypothetical protein